MAETVVAMMLSHARGLLRAYSLQRDEAWPNQTLEPGLRLLKGSRVTVLGFGHIGSHIGRLLKCFGAVISGLRRNPGERPDYFAEEDRLLRAEHLDEVLPQSSQPPDSAAYLRQRPGVYRPVHRRAYPASGLGVEAGRRP
jgi:phosphoglycerate dehydrogenase-like enzyme